MPNRLLRFLRLVAAITRKDWLEHQASIKAMLLFLVLSVALIVGDPEGADFGKGAAVAALLAMTFLFAQLVFHGERTRGTLDSILKLPATAFAVIVAKYLSMYSMILFIVNVPGVFLRDWRLLLWTNGLTLFLATVFVTCGVVVRQLWASLLPAFVLLPIAMRVNGIGARYISRNTPAVGWVVQHMTVVSLCATGMSVLLAIVSALVFARQQRP